MIHGETQDQELYNEHKALPADAEPLLGKVDEIVPAPPHGDEWVAEAVRAVEASITKLMDEFRIQPFIHRVEHSLHIRLVQLLGEWEHLRGWYPIESADYASPFPSSYRSSDAPAQTNLKCFEADTGLFALSGLRTVKMRAWAAEAP